MATIDTESSSPELGRITTDIPARLDRLPWARWHWMIVIGLGTVWILDGLEVTIVGNLSAVLKDGDTGLGLTSSDIGMAGAVYVAGACLGALFFGQLTDRFGRKRLFMVTLLVYLVGTVLTAFSMNPTWYFVCRFITGAGIGGEYAAINSAIDELIPAKYRGRIDISINGSFWVGAAAGSLLTIPLTNPDTVNPEFGWRFAFALGAVLGLAVLWVRKNVPESPRWSFIHGKEQEGERIVKQIETEIEKETGEQLPSVDETITIRQRKTIGMGTIAHTVFALYPKRTVLCLSLFAGQAFLYNAFFFTFGDSLTTFLDVKQTGWYIAAFAVSNFAGALILGPLFDRVGRIPMIAGTYILSGVLLAIAGTMLSDLSAVTLTGFRHDRVLLRLGGCKRGLPHGLGGIPDGDSGDVHRVLLRSRHGDRWHRRAAVLRSADRQRHRVQEHRRDRTGLLPRRSADDRRGDRGDLPGRQGRGRDPRKHCKAPHRRGRLSPCR